MDEEPTSQMSSSIISNMDQVNLNLQPLMNSLAEPIQDIFDKFQEIDSNRISNFQKKMQDLSVPQVIGPSSSIINQIFTSFKLYTSQGEILDSEDITIPEEEFNLWKARNKLENLSIKSFPNK